MGMLINAFFFKKEKRTRRRKKKTKKNADLRALMSMRSELRRAKMRVFTTSLYYCSLLQCVCRPKGVDEHAE